jgi:hypothetical protein
MSKVALVVGCSSNVWADAKRAQTLWQFDAIYCVKQIGIYWPGPFDVWATLHPEKMDEYEAARAAKGFPAGYEIVAPLETMEELGTHTKAGRISRRVSYRYPGMNSSASSGLYGAKVALDDGFRVVLAGIPMQMNVGHFLPNTKNVHGLARSATEWKERDSFENGFLLSIPHMRDRTKSMSGITRDVFGEPTLEWLRGDPMPLNSAQDVAGCHAQAGCLKT